MRSLIRTLYFEPSNEPFIESAAYGKTSQTNMWRCKAAPWRHIVRRVAKPVLRDAMVSRARRFTTCWDALGIGTQEDRNQFESR